MLRPRPIICSLNGSRPREISDTGVVSFFRDYSGLVRLVSELNEMKKRASVSFHTKDLYTKEYTKDHLNSIPDWSAKDTIHMMFGILERQKYRFLLSFCSEIRLEKNKIGLGRNEISLGK